MDTKLLCEKYANQIDGVLHCYDRILISGNLDPLCYAAGMAGYLRAHEIRLFDYAQFAQPLREEIRQKAETLAQQHGLKIEFVRKKKFRKEDRVQAVLKQRGTTPGLVHIFSAMESCASYQPWHDKATGKTILKYTESKCLHYYVYFIDKDFGLCYLRVPTWCPFRLQFYCNGHAWLANQLARRGIAYTQRDNAFLHIADYTQANRLAEQFDAAHLHKKLDRWAREYCPVVKQLRLTYHWNIWQAEYATDLVFKQRADLQALYPHLLETLIHTVKPDDIATFLGRKLHGNFQGEVGSRFNVRLLGTRLKHSLETTSLKLYDKFGQILRLETTTNDVTFFRQYRDVRHRDGSTETKWAPMKKTIYRLGPPPGMFTGRQPPLPGIPLRHRNAGSGGAGIGPGDRNKSRERPSLQGFQFSDRSRCRPLAGLAARRVRHQRDDQPRPACALPGENHRTDQPPGEATAGAWPAQEGRASLQILPDGPGPARCDHGAQTAGAARHSRLDSTSSRVTRISLL